MMLRKESNFESVFKRGYLWRLIISYAILSFMPVIFVSAVIYNHSREIIDEEVSKSVKDLLKQTSGIISDIYYETRDIYFQAAQSTIATEDLIPKSEEYFSTYEGIRRVKDLISAYNNLAKSNKYIESIYAYIANYGKVVTSDNGVISLDQLRFKKWITDDFENDKKMEFIKVKDRDVFGYIDDKYYYSFRGKYYTMISTTSDMLLVNLDVEAINEKIKQLVIRQSGYVVVTDAGGRILFGTDKGSRLRGLDTLCNQEIILNQEEGYYIDEAGGKQTMVVFTTIAGLGWKEIALIPLNEITGKMEFMKGFTIGVTLISIVAAVLFSLLISTKIYKPLDLLVLGMKKAEGGDLNVSIANSRKDEFGYLHRVFNNMMARINELVIDTYKLKLLYKDAELKAMQAQINPHFLHNTLNSMYCMAKSGGEHELAKMIYKLSGYFRISFSTMAKVIDIEEEIEHIRCYIDIQAIRYPGKFAVEFNIDESIYRHKILRFLIQPLVENSIIHGMKGRKADFKIILSGVPEGPNILFKVIDNGIGISGDKLRDIQESLEKSDMEAENFALKNIHNRMKLFYGEEYGLKIHSVLNEGTAITLLIPVK